MAEKIVDPKNGSVVRFNSEGHSTIVNGSQGQPITKVLKASGKVKEVHGTVAGVVFDNPRIG